MSERSIVLPISVAFLFLTFSAFHLRPIGFAQAGSQVTFTDITDSAHISFKHEASMTTPKYLPETMGSGVAGFDYDNDGWLDIFSSTARSLMPRRARCRTA